MAIIEAKKQNNCTKNFWFFSFFFFLEKDHYIPNEKELKSGSWNAIVGGGLNFLNGSSF